MKLNGIIKEFKFDKRIADSSFQQQRIENKEYEKHKESLPDLASESEKIFKEPDSKEKDSKEKDFTSSDQK